MNSSGKLPGLNVVRTVCRPHKDSVVPPIGPGWFGSVMGTGILANLLTTVGTQSSSPLNTIAHYASGAFLVLGWCILVFLVGGFTWRCCSQRRVLTESITDLNQTPSWGMVSMGLMAVGSATPVIAKGFSATPQMMDLAYQIDLVLWIIATIIGTLSATGFTYSIIRNQLAEPRPVWGLALVPPMVSATTGALQVPELTSSEAQVLMLTLSTASFFLALILGGIVFSLAYAHAWRRSPLPLAAMPSSWVPLGIVGQSTAAAQAIALQAQPLSVPEAHSTISTIANCYGYLILLLGIPMIIAAVWMTSYGFTKNMPFSPGWWALTFPVGTLSLGTHLLSQGSHLQFFHYISYAFLVLLVLHWFIAATGTIGAIQGKSSS